MLSINTNLSSLIAQRSMKQSTNKLNQAIERMTTGAKINHAKDNAANYNIATNMTTKLGALQVAEDNCAMGLDMLATANGTLDQIYDKLQRLRDLAVQVSNGTYGSQSKQAINAEANALVDEIERLYNTTEYNGINLMKGQVTGTEESNFIKDIDRRDTSKMTTLASVDVSTKLNSGTYSISTPEELAKLATMTNNGLVGENCEFVLAADIDLSAYSSGEGWIPIGTVNRGAQNPREFAFYGDYNGNGYTITGLKIARAKDNQGLFGAVICSELQNISIQGATISASGAVDTIKDHAILTGFAGDGSIIENCCVTGAMDGGNWGTLSGGIVGQAYNGTIVDSCFADVVISGVKWDVGGIAGNAQLNSFVSNCFANVDIASESTAGGLCGLVFDNSGVENCYATGSINGFQCAGLIGSTYMNARVKNVWTDVNITGSRAAGLIFSSALTIIENAYVLSENSNYEGIFACALRKNRTGETILKNSYYSSFYDGLSIPLGNFSEFKSFNVQSYAGDTPFLISNDSMLNNYSSNFNLQVGTQSNSSSSIAINFEDALWGLSSLRHIGKASLDFISIVDKAHLKISDLQIKYGATENRLNSALEEISTQYENLVSSRSTLQDADIAEVSSEYIRQQILQQASATLLTTANQSASIALSLI